MSLWNSQLPRERLPSSHSSEAPIYLTFFTNSTITLNLTALQHLASLMITFQNMQSGIRKHTLSKPGLMHITVRPAALTGFWPLTDDKTCGIANYYRDAQNSQWIILPQDIYSAAHKRFNDTRAGKTKAKLFGVEASLWVILHAQTGQTVNGCQAHYRWI